MADIEPAPALSPAAPPPYEAGGEAEKGRRNLVAVADINQNINAKISNPLAGIPRGELLANVTKLAEEQGLTEHLHVIRQGALVAQDSLNFEAIDGEYALDQTQKDALYQEILHKWRVPKLLYLTIITCSIGAAVQGWDQEGSNGANLRTIFLSAVICLITPIGGALTQNWEQLLITRLLLGIGMGFKASTVPIYAAENSPAAIRGALVMCWQMWTAFGILLGVCANLIVGRVPNIAWRLQIGSAFIPAIPLCLLIPFCPESPRWFMKKNRYKDAYKSLIRLRNHPIQAARDLNSIHAQLLVEREAIHGSTYVGRLIELFTVPVYDMCGINIIVFYSSTVFVDAGTDEYTALLASFGFGLVNFVFAWPAIWTIDTFGRRSLLLFTFPNMAWSLLAAGLCSLIPGTGGAHLGLVALFIYIFAAFYSPGEGPVPFTYSAEVFPLSHREVGMAWAVATCLFWAAVLSITFPKILATLGVVGAFGLYAGFNVVAFFMIFLFLPETKQRTLEELDYVFAVPTKTFIHYNTTKWAPWYFKRWVLFQKDANLEPLYHFDRPSHGSDLSQTRLTGGYTESRAAQNNKNVSTHHEGDEKATTATGVDI
ncbi:hypothetical protein PG994_001827 [Apiospora phragmitis]|uniref:Major facilitator superfamily (MFS) profile domain-containing protein n=1 Tax=Apiospora phragmitis TaxID=2905665 RepID=A0ABR1WUK6_9PEZI